MQSAVGCSAWGRSSSGVGASEGESTEEEADDEHGDEKAGRYLGGKDEPRNHFDQGQEDAHRLISSAPWTIEV